MFSYCWLQCQFVVLLLFFSHSHSCYFSCVKMWVSLSHTHSSLWMELKIAGHLVAFDKELINWDKLQIIYDTHGRHWLELAATFASVYYCKFALSLSVSVRLCPSVSLSLYIYTTVWTLTTSTTTMHACVCVWATCKRVRLSSMLRKKEEKRKNQTQIKSPTSATIEAADEVVDEFEGTVGFFAICQKICNCAIRYGEWLISGIKCH